MEKYYKREEWYHLIPLMLLVIIVPLIVHLKVIPLTGAAYDFWSGEKQNHDFFSYYKMVWLIVFTVFALFMVLVKQYETDFQAVRRKSVYYIPMIIYTAMVILSTLFSRYRSIAAKGFVDRYEGMYVLIAYMVIMFVTINLVNKDKHIKVLLGALFVGAVIIGIIGICQYMGQDIWQKNFGKSLMLGEKYKSRAGELKFDYGKNTIYSTLYHYDYVGSYMAMLFPLTFAIFILIKNKIYKIIMAFITLLMAANWVGCNSRAGIVGGMLAILMMLIMINKYIKHNWKYFVFGIVAVIVAFVGLNKASDGFLGKRIASLFKDAKAITAKSSVDKNASLNIPLKDIKVDGKKASIVTSTETLNICLVDGGVVFQDDTNKMLNIKFENQNGKITIMDDRYKAYNITYGNMKGEKALVVEKAPIKFYFKLGDNKIELINNRGNVIDLKPVEKWGFEGKELLGSSRGYIWSRSIPLLKHTALIGYGPDTFAIHFPQYDFMGKMYAYSGDMWQVVDKPHNLYLQIGINTGVLSLIAFLALIIMYIVKSVKIYFTNDFSSFTAIAGVGVFSAIIGYLGAAFFNDSVVSVAPIFWMLLGLGIAINQMLGACHRPKKTEICRK